MKAALATLLVAALALPLPVAGSATAADASAPTDIDAGQVEDAVGSTEVTTDSTTNATDTVEDTAENASDPTENTTDSTNVTDTVEDTAENASDPTENTTDSTNVTDTVEDTADSTENTTDTVKDTTDTVEDTTQNATDSVTNTTDAVESVAGDGNTTTDGKNPTAATDAGAVESTAGPRTTRTDSASAGSDGTGAGGGGDGGGAVAVGVGAAVAAALTRRTTTAAVAGVPGASALQTATAAGRRAVRDWLSRVLGLLGYSRYDDSDPLEHDIREALYRRISGDPGQHLSALDEGTEGSFSSVRHHLRVLERENLVTSRRVRGRRRYFPAGTDRPELAAALVDESTGAVLRTLARTGPASVSDLAAELDRDPSTVTHHLQRLADDGLIERERDGRRVENRLASGVAVALRENPTGVSSD